MADLLGLRFIAVGVPIEQIDHKLKPGVLKLIARTPEAYIYENPHTLPRVLLVNDWKSADFEALMASGKWPQFNPRETVLLEEPPEFDDEIVRLAKHSGIGAGARIRHYENTKVVIDVDAARPGFVVLHDVWHPWWVAHLDGLEVPILRANVLFRAVHVPAGRHVLTFEFQPVAGVIAEVADRLLEPPEPDVPPGFSTSSTPVRRP
jgi:hypothetical protein